MRQIAVIDIDGFEFDGELSVISNGWCKLKISDLRKRAKVKNEIIPLNSVYIKPYLRPLSSMTEEEYDDMFHQLYSAQEEFFRNCSNTDTIGKLIANDMVRYDWLDKNMFDYRGLIPKGLALEAKDGKK